MELAASNDLAELWGETLGLDDLLTVEPVLDMRSADDDAGRIPVADGVDQLASGRGDEVVERAFGAISVLAGMSVRMYGVVENLVLKANGLAGFCGVDEILDTAVRSASDAEVDG